MTGVAGRLAVALSDRYRIERELGQGGMATVYLAQDLKHDRKVAIKVLRPELAAVLGAERFVVEIKTTAALQHPHILPLFDSGTADGFLYYVMPYIQGETLRTKLDRETQLGIEEAVRITREVADALDYAHRHGVIHRDIKPENILLHDGRPMVADFGIALAVSAAAGGRMTETGLSLGTPHYMSPEQATAAKELTSRSDIYALGCVLYEMLTGSPPHVGATAQQIIMKIVTEEAAPVAKLRKSVPPHVAAAAGKALEKLPADRFDTARAFAEALGNPAFSTVSAARSVQRSASGRTSIRAWMGNPWSWGAMAVIGGLAVAGFALRGAGHPDGDITFTQKTFRAEAIYTTRYAPDGQTIVFSSAGTEGTVPRLFIIRPDNPEPAPLGRDSTHLLAISSTGQLAVLTGARYIGHRVFQGTLATLPLGGGAPREVLGEVRDADWSPDGTSLAVIRNVAGVDRLEYPIGTTLYQAAGYLSDVRVAPAGDAVAFFEHPVMWDDRGEVVIVERTGKTVARSVSYWSLEGLAWGSDGKQVFYSGAADTASSYTMLTVRALDRRGRSRVALASAGGVTLQDVAGNGRWLVTRDETRYRLFLHDPATAEDRDLGWPESSTNPVLSADARVFAFSDQGLTGGRYYTVLFRKTDGSPAARLGEGDPLAFSPDARSLLVAVLSTPPRLHLYSTGPGESRRLDQGQFESLAFTAGALFANGERFFVCGSLPEQGARCFTGAVAGGPFTPVTPEGTVQAVISPDGESVVAQVGNEFHLIMVADGATQPALGLTTSDGLSRWSPNGRDVWVHRSGHDTIRVDRVDPRTGRRSVLSQFAPPHQAGRRAAEYVKLADDPRVIAYQLLFTTSALFAVEGVR